MDIKIKQPYGFSYIGKKANNEDSIYPISGESSVNSSLFLVCDGVGGLDKGEVASQILSSTLAESLSSGSNSFVPTQIVKALEIAYARLGKEESPDAYQKMGTTLTLLKLHKDGATVAHIGDSRVYHIRPSASKPILFKTRDHSLVMDLVEAGMITEEEAANHPKRNVITRAFQPHQPEMPKPDISETKDIKEGDYFFLCTDGVLENISDDLLVSILKSKKTDKDKILEIEAICEGQTKDNYSAYLVPISTVSGGVTPKPIEASTPTAQVVTPPRKNKLTFALLVIIGLLVAFIGYRELNLGSFWHHNTEIKKEKEIKNVKKATVKSVTNTTTKE